MKSSFSSGFFLLKKEKQAKEKRDCRSAGKAYDYVSVAVQQSFEFLQLNDFAKRLLMMQSKVTLCFCTRNEKKRGIGGVQRGNSLSETDRNRAFNFY